MREPILLLTLLILASRPAAAEDLRFSVNAAEPAGTLPTWYEPSAFIGWTTPQMLRELGDDAKTTHGLFVASTHLYLGPSTSLEDYRRRLESSGLAATAAAVAERGAQLLVQVHGMPRWISSSNVSAKPPGCEEEWPTYQTVAPDPARWSEWEAAVAATVRYFSVDHGLRGVWFQLWEEPDAPCFWTDTQASYLETWRHFVIGARSVDPEVKLGGPEPAGGPGSIKPGESTPLLQAFLEFSKAQGLRPDFVSYHLFGAPPEAARAANRQVLALLEANGFAGLPIVVGSWNPLDACYEDNEKQDDPSWPSPPSPNGCWQTDNEMGAAYSLAFMSYLAGDGAAGYQAMYQLDDAALGPDEFPHDWGARTNKDKGGLRKAIYHAQTLVGRLPRTLVTSTLTADHASYFPHVWGLAGGSSARLSLLLWSYVTSPGRQAVQILHDLGYGKAELARWGGQAQLEAFAAGAVSAGALTADPIEQADLERVKGAYLRQRALVTEANHLEVSITGLSSTTGYCLSRFLIDAEHNNAYASYLKGGIGAASADQTLRALDTQWLPDLSSLPDVELAPYAVMLLELTPAPADRAGDCPAPEIPQPTPAPTPAGCACDDVGGPPALGLLALLGLLRRRSAASAKAS